MKKILAFTFLTLLLFSCGPIKYPYRQYSSAIDFSDVTRSGFFITESNSVSFPYDPIGSVSAVAESGYEVIKGAKEQTQDDIYSFDELSKMKFGKYKFAQPEDVISELISSAKELGANGIINLKITYTPATYANNGIIISPSSYVASGMAIKK